MGFLEIFNKILKFMEKTILDVKGKTVVDILKKFQYLTDQLIIVQNVRSNYNKYLLTRTFVRVI